MARRTRGTFTDYTSEGKRNQELQDQIDKVNDRLDGIGGNNGVSDPAPCTPDFAIDFTAKKSRIRATFCAEIPTGMEVIGAIIIADAYYNVDQDTFDANKIDAEVDIDPDASTLGHVEWLFPPVLDYDTTYHLMRLIVTDGNGTKYRNPPGKLLFNSPSLADFTTPSDVLAPNRPHVGNIIENNLDDTTSRKFDAWVSVQIIAPASASNNLASTVTVTLNSTSVNGSGFTGNIAVGNGIEVNGETHIVTNVNSNILLTVDYPFKQATASGQTATRKVLHTFATAQYAAVAPKFRAVGDTENKAISPHFVIDDTNETATNVIVKVLGFAAAKSYNYVHNVGVGFDGRHTASPLTTQTFIAGNFTNATNGIPEWTTAPFFQYDATNPQNDNKRAVSLRITQTSPPVAIDKVRLYKRNSQAGTISGSTTTITGSGTTFLTDLAPGHFIIASSQTLEVVNVSTDTSLTVVTAPSPSLSGVAWTKSVLVDDFSLQIGKFHPSAGGLVPPIKFGEIKTKKLVALTYAAEIYPLNGATFRTVTDAFTPNGEEPDDTGVATGLATPVLEWTAEGRFKVQNMQATTNIHTRKEVYLVITDNIGNYLNLTTGLVTTSEASARFRTGNKGHINLSNLRLKKYRTAFGDSANIFAYYYIENDFGTSAASSLSSAVNLANPEDYMGDRSTVRGVDVEVTQLSPMNILLNGDLFIETSTVNECDNFFLRLNATYPIQGANNITTASSNLRWDRASHSLRWLTASREICLTLKQRLEPAGYYTLTFMVRSDTTGWSTTPTFHFYNGQQSVAIDNIVDTIGTQITFTDTSYHLFYAVLQFTTATGSTLTSALESSPGAGDYAAHYLCIDLNTVSHDVYMDKFMLVRGQQQMAYAPNGAEANTNLTNTVAPSFVSFPDFVSLGATASGRYGTNDGGLIDFQPY